MKKKMDITVAISCVGFMMVYTSQFMMTWDRYKKSHDKGADILRFI